MPPLLELSPDRRRGGTDLAQGGTVTPRWPGPGPTPVPTRVPQEHTPRSWPICRPTTN